MNSAILVDEIYRVKIRPLSPAQRREIADFLGVSYFTLMGKLSKTARGNFTPTQRQKLKEWFGGRGTGDVSETGRAPEGDDPESGEILSGARP